MENNLLCIQIVLFHSCEHFSYLNIPLPKGVEITEDALYFTASLSILQDPYFMRNHLGTYECKLCLTLHNTEVTRAVTNNQLIDYVSI